MLPASAFPWRPAINPAPKVKALIEMLKAYADKNHIIYLDYFTVMTNPDNGLPATLSKDGVHPTLEGYKVMEPLAEKAIGEALKKRK